MWTEERDREIKVSRDRVSGEGRVRGFGGPRVLVAAGILTSAFCLLTSAFGRGTWHGIYSDAPIAVHITPSKKVFQVGDSFRLSITATNTSDRELLIKKDWTEQLVFYHLLPSSLAPRPSPPVPSSQVEWPGKVLIATWMDSIDVVRLEPNQSYTVNRYVRTWIPEDVATFQFRIKLGGVNDYGRKFDMWQGIAWSNPTTLTVKPRR
jgi:hypothetical protein